jgi:hypothetical protein
VLKGKGALLSDDPARQARYENLLKATVEMVNTDGESSMRLRIDEMASVRKALELEHRAYFVRGLAVMKFKAARKETAKIRRQLASAEGIAKRVKFYSNKRGVNERVSTLRLKFAHALAHEKSILQKYVDENNKAKADIEEAQRYRKLARRSRDQRIEYITKAVSAYIADRGGEGSQERDIRKLGEPDCDIELQEKIRVRFLQDFIIIKSVYYANAERAIAGFIECDILSHADERWRRYIGDNDSQLCEKLQEKYCPIAPDYDYKDLTPFERQRERLVPVFGRENDLLTYARFYYDNGLLILGNSRCYGFRSLG